MEEIRLQTSAKINLSLSVLGRRADGYHELDGVMQSVSLFDRMTVKKSSRITVACGAFGGENNLAFRAARLFFAETGIDGGAEIKIEKAIPSPAGLGGGSSDAAATLAALDRLYETRLPAENLAALAARLGADVPFFLMGGTARAQGIGERLTPLPSVESCFFVIATTDGKPSTAEMYARLDSAEYPKPDVDQTVRALLHGDFALLSDSLGNSFSALYWDSPLPLTLKSTGADAVSLSGSGPAWFGLYRERETARRAEQALRQKKINCRFCESIKKSIFFE